MSNPNTRDEFFANVRRALGRTGDTPSFVPDEATGLSQGADAVEERAEAIRREIEANADDLMAQLEVSAKEGGWKVARVASAAEASQYIQSVARDIEARSVLRSEHLVFEQLGLEAAFEGTGIALEVMAIRDAPDDEVRETQRSAFRQKAIAADLGITGVDYAIAETGTCVLIPRKGLSRVVSLLPPVHVAVVERGQVLPSLDELFTLRRREFLHDNLGSYMNLITGPSRSADIEYTLVTGVHGPGEVHMVLIG